MLYEEILDARVERFAQHTNSGELVPLDVAFDLMAEGIYVEEIEFEVDYFSL